MPARPSFASALAAVRDEDFDEFEPVDDYADVWSRTSSFLWEGEPPAAFARADAYEDAQGDPPPAPPPERPPAPPSDDLDAIARELALPSLTTRAALLQARRRFMWANHPDRRPDWPRDLATRRVALANMMIDRALRGRPAGG